MMKQELPMNGETGISTEKGMALDAKDSVRGQDRCGMALPPRSDRTRVMGIVNVTPDSFSDGGQFYRPEEAVRRARNLIEEGADIIDLGGESTRPGATPLTWEEEFTRLEPVLSELLPGSVPSRSVGSVPISVDTYHPETARRAVAMGARIINCVAAQSAPEMLQIIRENEQVELVLPASYWGLSPEGESHSPGERTPEEAGVWERIYLDPLIGFGTTREEDLARLRGIGSLCRYGRVLVGVSRKRIVKKLTGERVTGKNLGGNLALALWCAQNGVSVIRVHDVRETVQALRVIEALRGEESAGK